MSSRVEKLPEVGDKASWTSLRMKGAGKSPAGPSHVIPSLSTTDVPFKGNVHRRDQILLDFYPTCNICGNDDSYVPDENVLNEILSIPSLGFDLACGGAFYGGQAGLISPAICTGMTSVTATGICGCISTSPTETPVLIYENDFENPLIPVPVDCGSNLHIGDTVNAVFGTEQLAFRQVGTVETVIINSRWSSTIPYNDPQEIGGKYSIGMFGAVAQDLLALDFDTQGKSFVNVELDLSTIDVVGCRVPPFTGADAILRLTLLDSPGGGIIFSGTVLDSADVTSPAAANAWTFDWTRSATALNASAATNGRVALVFNLLSPVYGTFDNLVIEASDEPVVLED